MTKQKRYLNIIENFKGDKVIWTIFFLLILWSVVSIFSSTSQLVTDGHNRLDILRDQVTLIFAGIIVTILTYSIGTSKIFKCLGRWMFLLTFVFLVLLLSHEQFLPLKAATINEAWRIFKLGSFQIHIYEVIKVIMVMYLAWAVDTFQNGRFSFAIFVSKLHPKLKPLADKAVQKWIYIYVPMFLTAGMMLPGSMTGALFTLIIMLLTVLIGGLSVKDLITPSLILGSVILSFFVINHVSGYKIANRQRVWEQRFIPNSVYIEEFKQSEKKSTTYYESLGRFSQPYSAKIAVKEGGFMGKGPGNSTQRYIVPMMFEDYMYSFIVEEYGLVGGLFVMILYLSLLARGSIVARHCKTHHSKVLVAGLVLLISGQAMLHIMVGVDLMPLTGQTLPLISHGKSAFLVFCVAFGIILGISREAQNQITKETKDTQGINS